MKILMRIILMIFLLIVGFAAGFPIGQNRGFLTGSEWSFVQANILAREAGLFMPVNYEAGQFKIMLKQPKHLYKRAWQLADLHENNMANNMDGEAKALNERIQLIRNASLQQ